MAFFDELGKALSDTGKVVVGKTKDITGALQLKAKVSQEKDKINQAYIELGKAFYDILKTAPEETYASEVKTISEGLLVIEDLDNQIMELEGTRICAECGAKVDRGAKFCSKCGTPLPEMPPKEGPNPAQDWADVGKAADDCVKAATDMAAQAAAAAECVGQDIAEGAERAVKEAADNADAAARALNQVFDPAEKTEETKED